MGKGSALTSVTNVSTMRFSIGGRRSLVTRLLSHLSRSLPGNSESGRVFEFHGAILAIKRVFLKGGRYFQSYRKIDAFAVFLEYLLLSEPIAAAELLKSRSKLCIDSLL